MSFVIWKGRKCDLNTIVSSLFLLFSCIFFMCVFFLKGGCFFSSFVPFACDFSKLLLRKKLRKNLRE